MSKIRKGKKKCISVLLLAVMLIAAAATSIYGANRIDLDAEASLTLQQQDTSWEELGAQTYDVPLYLVATVDAAGSYTLTDDFLVESLRGIESVTDETTADEWNNYAKAAKAAADASKLKADETLHVADGSASMKIDVLGLYLADVPTVTTDTNEYVADPLLIAVPGNNYYSERSDDWIYEVSSEMKFQRNDLLGNLVITKTIDSFNESLGNAAFVFKVTAVKDYAYKANEADKKTVYNNVVAIDFSSAGTKSVTIKDLPAGAVVTVSEVYSGANYSVSGSQAQMTVIRATGDAASVSFTNTYDQTLTTGGTAVINSFSYDNGVWVWNASYSNQ